MIPKLSILIAAIDSRLATRAKLITGIREQCKNLPEGTVEIWSKSDDGTMIVGTKRNLLLEKAEGEYVSFIDDDDQVAETYIEDILGAIEKRPDCVTFKGIVTTDLQNPEEFNFSMYYPHNIWEKDTKGVHMRCPSIWCAIKSDIAKSVKFLDVDCAEDRVWAIQIYPLLNSEVHIDKHLYFYRASATGTEAQKKEKRDRAYEIISQFRYTPFIRPTIKETKDVTVSFTTIAGRIDRIRPMVESLKAQTFQPKRICLYVTNEVSIPEFLNELGVEIHRISDPDWGPATKLIPFLVEEKDPEAKVIVVDDDIVYDDHMIETLVSASEKWPDCAIGRVGGVGKDYVHSECNIYGIPALSDGLGGYRGALYKRKFFDLPELIEQYKATTTDNQICSDDHLFSFHIQKRGVPAIITPNFPIVLSPAENFDSTKIIEGVQKTFLNLDPGIQGSPRGDTSKKITNYFNPILFKENRMIVSFTSTSERVDKIRPMIESLLNQTVQPSRIRLYIPYGCQVPSFLSELKVDVRFTRDWGQATKIIPLLVEEKDPEAEILTLWDGSTYDPHTIEDFAEFGSKWKSCAIGMMGITDTTSTFAHTEYCTYGTPAEVTMLAGYRGIFLRRKFFDVEKLIELYGRTTPANGTCSDDCLVSYHLRGRGIPLVVAPHRRPLPDYYDIIGNIQSRFLNLPESGKDMTASAEAIKNSYPFLKVYPDGTCSYVPVLASLVAKTTGPVLELGAGSFSTPLLSVMCKGRKLLTIENDREWLAKWLPYESPTHKLLLIDTIWEDRKELETEGPWDVAFVDHHPNDHRAKEVERLRNHAKFIVVHDTCPDTEYIYGFNPVFKSFTYRRDYRRVAPWTTVVSMTDPIPEFYSYE